MLFGAVCKLLTEPHLWDRTSVNKIIVSCERLDFPVKMLKSNLSPLSPCISYILILFPSPLSPEESEMTAVALLAPHWAFSFAFDGINLNVNDSVMEELSLGPVLDLTELHRPCYPPMSEQVHGRGPAKQQSAPTIWSSDCLCGC